MGNRRVQNAMVAVVLVLALGWSLPVAAQYASTPNLGLKKPTLSTTRLPLTDPNNWANLTSANLDLLDSILYGSQGIAPKLAESTVAGSPTCNAGSKNQLRRITDNIRGLWTCNGTAWVSVTGYADVAGDFATGGSGASGSPWSGWRTDINALPADTHVHFRSGSYTLSASILAKSGWRITGEGYATRIQADGTSTFKVFPEPVPYTGDGGLIVLYGTNNASVSDLALDGNRQAKANAGIYGIELLGDDGTQIHNVWIENIPSGINNGLEGDGIIIGHSASASSNVSIDQVRIKNFNRTGIAVNRASNVAISHFAISTSLDTNTGAGIDLEPDGEQIATDIEISNGSISTTHAGIMLVGDTDSTGGPWRPRNRNIVISNVTLSNIQLYGLYVHGENISIVNVELTSTNLAAAGNGLGAIHFPGVDVNKPAPATRVGIVGGGIYQSGGHGIYLGDVNTLTIAGMTIKESDESGIVAAFLTDNVHKDNLTLIGNTITDNNNNGADNASGILFEADTPLRLMRNLTIAGNTITDTQAPKTQKYAIYNRTTNSDVSTWSIGTNSLGAGIVGPITAGIDGVAAKFSGAIVVPQYVEGAEISDPPAPVTNYGRLYFKDNGGTPGKTQLVVRFPTGAVQVLALEP